MPPWDQTGVPIHFHSSRISGSASCMISRTLASIFPRQSPSSLIFSSINAEADSTGTGLFMYSSNSRTYFTYASAALCSQSKSDNSPYRKCALFVRPFFVLSRLRSFRRIAQGGGGVPPGASAGLQLFVLKFVPTPIPSLVFRRARSDARKPHNRWLRTHRNTREHFV
jgi:hypothetical protein